MDAVETVKKHKKYLFRRTYTYFIQNKSEFNPLQQTFISNGFRSAPTVLDENFFCIAFFFLSHKQKFTMIYVEIKFKSFDYSFQSCFPL